MHNLELFGERPITAWDVGRNFVGRELLGKLIALHGETPVRRAIVDTLWITPADPKTYMLGILKNGAHEKAPGDMSDAELLEACEAREISTRGRRRLDLERALRVAPTLT